jgi:hypothetical protein
MSDNDAETAPASDAAADDETTVVPGPTQVAAALAWSEEEQSEEEQSEEEWSGEDEAAETHRAPKGHRALMQPEGDDDDREPKLGRRHRELLKWLRPDDDVWNDEDDAAYTRGTVKIFVGLIAVAVIAAAWMVGVWATHRGDDSAPSASGSLSREDQAFLDRMRKSGWPNGWNIITDPTEMVRDGRRACYLLQQGTPAFQVEDQLSRELGLNRQDTNTLTINVMYAYPNCYTTGYTAQTPAAAPTTTVTAPSPTTDAAFERSLRREGINVDGRTGGINTMIMMAKDVCTDMSHGTSRLDAANGLLAISIDMTRDQSVEFVDSAVESYCPPTVTAPAPPT